MGLFDNFATLPTTLNYKPTAIKTNISAPEFDSDAGRQEAYNQQWKAYIDNLSQSNKKINLNKAKQYFDTQFDQDWFNETGQRQQQFNKIFQPSREQELQNSENAYNQFTANLFNSFAKPTPKLKTEGLDFSNVQAVQNWLLANNYNPGKADNMYGIKTKTAIDTLLNDTNSGLTEEEKQMFRNFQGNTQFVRTRSMVPAKHASSAAPDPLAAHANPNTRTKPTDPVASTNNKDSFNSNGQSLPEVTVSAPRIHWADRFRRNQQGALIWNWGTPTSSPKTYTYNGQNYDVRKDPSGNLYYVDRRKGLMKQVGKEYLTGSAPKLWDKSDWVRIADDVFKRKNGGIINKHQQGGTMNRINYFQQGGAAPQQDIQKQIIALVQAAMQGDQKATQTVNQIMEAAKAGDQQAVQLAQMIQAVIQKMKGQATAAKWGAKLGYIRSLKYAKGGKTCPACQALEKGDKVEKKACGGKKAKKHYFGGWL